MLATFMFKGISPPVLWAKNNLTSFFVCFLVFCFFFLFWGVFFLLSISTHLLRFEEMCKFGLFGFIQWSCFQLATYVDFPIVMELSSWIYCWRSAKVDFGWSILRWHSCFFMLALISVRLRFAVFFNMLLLWNSQSNWFKWLNYGDCSVRGECTCFLEHMLMLTVIKRPLNYRNACWGKMVHTAPDIT